MSAEVADSVDARSEARARVLLELAQTVGGWRNDLDAALGRITETAARMLEVDRASVWLSDAGQGSIRCAHVHGRNERVPLYEGVLLQAELPAYFEAIATERTLAARDVARDPRTRELAAIAEEHGVGALLDVPIRRGGAVVGILCHEHMGEPRAWTATERSFAASLGDFVALALSERQRREAEASLRAGEEQLRVLAENVNDLIAGADAAGRITYLSPNHGEVFGIEPGKLLGSSVFEFIHPDDRGNVVRGFEETIASLGTTTQTYRLADRDGCWPWYEATGRAYRTSAGPIEFVVSARNITARRAAESEARELQAQLSQAQRLEAVGRLAGGIAHDFNNLLTAILGHLEVASSRSDVDTELRTELDSASSAALRAAELTHQLLALGRNQAIAPEIVDVNAALENLGRMIRRVIGEDVRLSIDLDPTLPPVRIDRTQLDQVVMNLAINCRDAMPRGGTLSIETSRVVADDAIARKHPSEVPGPHVCIEVRDSGVGMDGETRARVFDPFFTTKEPGKGAGLGLATVYQIVRETRGAIDLQSRPDAGTSVRLFFPAARDAGAQASTAAEQGTTAAAGGNERLLLVEDDDAVRRLLERALRKHGYEVITAADGREALSRLAERDGRIDLVVSDVVMPVMGGVELSRQLSQTHPEIKVLMLSGYAPPPLDEVDAGVLQSDRILQKPFTTRRLLDRVRALLEEKPLA